MTDRGTGPFSPEEQAEFGVGLLGQHPTAAAAVGGDLSDAEALAACMFDPDCSKALGDQIGGDTASSSVGTSSTSGSSSSSSVSKQFTSVDEAINVAQRVFFDIPTPEQFLDNFENAFAGFAASMRDAGLGDTDLRAMLDPSTGFIQSMFSEYMGKVAQRAQAGESPYELVGLEGETKQVGQREGDVVETDTTRLTVVEAEEILRKSGQQVTQSAVDSIIKESGKKSSSDSQETSSSSQTDSGTSKSTSTTKATSKTVVTENLFSRPGVARVFKFSPTDFLLEKFDVDNVDDVSTGMLSTLIKANAPLRRRSTGAVSVAARRT